MSDIEDTARAQFQSWAYDHPGKAIHYLRIDAGRKSTDIPRAIKVGECALLMAREVEDSVAINALESALARLREQN